MSQKSQREKQNTDAELNPLILAEMRSPDKRCGRDQLARRGGGVGGGCHSGTEVHWRGDRPMTIFSTLGSNEVDFNFCGVQLIWEAFSTFAQFQQTPLITSKRSSVNPEGGIRRKYTDRKWKYLCLKLLPSILTLISTASEQVATR